MVVTDPHSAGYAQAFMRALEDAGDRSGALQHAREYSRRMRADLGAEPDPGVVALAERLRTAPARRQTIADDDAARPSVAVLPFLNLTADREHDYFADGIT